MPTIENVIRPETPGDHTVIREVNRLAFGGEVEARLVDALRAGGYLRVSLVAEEAGRVVGHVLFSDLSIATPQGVVEALALAPLAVVPDRQRQGIGSALVRAGLRACTEQGHRIVVVVGHPEFYPRFGFAAERARRLRSPYSGPALSHGVSPNADSFSRNSSGVSLRNSQKLKSGTFSPSRPYGV